VVLNTAFRQLTMAVDTHIFRVSNRTGIARAKMSLKLKRS
jgi:endonuclease-3